MPSQEISTNIPTTVPDAEQTSVMDEDELKLEGRGQRKRNTVNYNDGLDGDLLAVSSSGSQLDSI